LIDQQLIAEQMADDPEGARAEWEAEFRSDVGDFVRREVVEACVVPGVYERPPESAYRGRYCAFVDPSGGSNDSMTIAISHREGEVACIDAVRERRPPFSPEQVVVEFAQLLQGYGVHRVVGDKYGGEWPRERFWWNKIHYEPAELPKSAIYLEALPLLNGRRVELLDDDRAIGQICSLERRTARSARESVDHAPGGHDDVANAILGAAWLAGRRQGGVIQQARLHGV
jgi:hypothetical protein